MSCDNGSTSRTTGGFTLIEMLVVTSLLGIISLAIFGALSGGVNLSRHLASEKFSNDLVLGWKRLHKDLRGQLKYRSIPFAGNEEEVSFPLLVSVGEGEERHNEIGRARYYHDSSCRCLCREKKSYVDLLTGVETECRPVFPSVTKASFEYYGRAGEGQGDWYSEWQGESPPLAVRLKLTLEGGSEKQFTAVLP